MPQIIETPEDLKSQVDQNYLLQMVARDKWRNIQSIKCACGKRTALIERPNQIGEEKNIYKVHLEKFVREEETGSTSAMDSTDDNISEESEEIFEIGELRDVVMNKI